MSARAEAVIQANTHRLRTLVDTDRARRADEAAGQDWYDAVAAARAVGYSAAELAEAIGVTARTIYRWAARGNAGTGGEDLDTEELVALRRRIGRLRTTLRSRARAAVAAGNTRQDVATVAGVDHHTIAQWLREGAPQ